MPRFDHAPDIACKSCAGVLNEDNVWGYILLQMSVLVLITGEQNLYFSRLPQRAQSEEDGLLC